MTLKFTEKPDKINLITIKKMPGGRVLPLLACLTPARMPLSSLLRGELGIPQPGLKLSANYPWGPQLLVPHSLAVSACNSWKNESG